MRRLTVKPFRVLSFDVTAAVTASCQLSCKSAKNFAGEPLDSYPDIERSIISAAADMLKTSIIDLHDTTTILKDLRNRLPTKYLALRFQIIVQDARLVKATKTNP